MQPPFITRLITKIATRLGAKVLVEPEYGVVGQITFKSGKTTFFRSINFNLNPTGSSHIAKDKGYTKFFLKKFGYCTPEGKTFFSDALNSRLERKRTIDEGWKYATFLGLPVIVKPNDLSQGTLVSKVYTKHEYYRAARAIFRRTNVLLVERFYVGNDYRIVVLDNKVISAYQRLPLRVMGDGRHTIAELLGKKQTVFKKQGRDTRLNFEDPRIRQYLGRQGFSLSTILPHEKEIFLLANANLSTGGEAKDVTDSIHPDFTKLAIDVTEKMGLRLCGIDIITTDLSQPAKKYIILEINSAPGLSNYRSLGRKQMKIVEDLYEQVIRALEKKER